MKKNIWVYCFFAILFFEVFHHLSAIQGLLDNSAITKSKNKDVVVDSISKSKKYNVLFFEADYGEESLGNGKYIFFVNEKNEFVLYSQLDSFSPNNLIYGKINNKIVVDDIPENTFQIINNDLVVYSDYKSSYSKFAFNSLLSTCTLEEIFKN